jgi:hypothetical protein
MSGQLRSRSAAAPARTYWQLVHCDFLQTFRLERAIRERPDLDMPDLEYFLGQNKTLAIGRL